MSPFFTVRKMARAGLIAAVYAALCLVLTPLSYGPVQIRFSEALTLLPVFCPEAVLGVALGCFIANMLGGLPLDMIVGTLATLLAALTTRKLRDVRFRSLPVAASLPPVVFNAVIVGGELAFLYPLAASPFMATWGFYMLTVGAGQLVSCCGLGLLLVWFIQKQPRVLALFCDESPLRR